ncbi:hydroxysqualene dehydroxylase HpnE [Streptomyces sp. WMMC897]|uniref:hydroxysqualene dehydroxylase HpnE n=1 Tax=Streptomyces sp. WMMC897 TaxID=3014782 RepID=UPI0022B67307|nr:hydroxysqualene dehydroxylase HpnE [Streptomyces sp. WMMC897]MCZ7415769.1 hydroxysqualene dehydroxylase HpnE [Streptomyces sp. WMMC897]
MSSTRPSPAEADARRGAESRRATVVGGGLAGITAALRLAEAGLRTTLVESRPRLGGLAFSFRRSSPAGELSVDNGQHVYLRCCTAYQGLLERVGARALAPLQRRLDIPVLDAGRARHRLGRIRRSAAPVPLHLTASLATYPHLSPAERIAAARAALALRGLDPADPALDAVDFGSWLRARGQSARSVRALWDLVGVATLNARAEHVSLALAAMVFRTGLLTAPGAADLGWARVPLGRLHDTLARRALERAGVRVLTGTRIAALRPGAEGAWEAVGARRAGRDAVPAAGTVVLAVPPDQAGALLPPGALDAPGRLERIGAAPILNVHVVYDRPVLRRPFFAAIGSPVQWVFDRTEAAGLPPGGGQYLALSQSAVHDEIDEPVAALRERYLPELARLLPGARGAGVRDFFVTREREATFAPAPGVERLRPTPHTRAPGVYLAGAWCATGWPATMESAVRSGHAAAREALDRLGRPAGDTPWESPAGRPLNAKETM